MSTSTLVRQVPAQPRTRSRLLSLDVLRGLAVVGMLLVNNAGVPDAMPAQLKHSVGAGLTLADLVFPLFLFVAGVGMSLSPRLGSTRSVLRRCALLALIGCLLVSAKYRHLSPSTGVLQHIAIATLGAYAVLRLPRRLQGWVTGGVLAAASLLPLWLTLPGTVAGSWDEQTTLASGVERALTGHVGKEQVVAAVVSSLTVLAGVLAGRVLRARPGRAGVRRLLLGAGVSGAAGLLLAPVVPVDESLWTPSFVLVSAGVCTALLAGAVALLDLRPFPRPAQPLRVLGANAIVVYVGSTLLYSAVLAPFRDWLVLPLRTFAGDEVAAIAYAVSALLVGWALASELWRRQVLIKI